MADDIIIKDEKNAASEALSREVSIGLYTMMLKVRLFEEKIVELYPKQEMRCPVHLCIGQEAIAAGVCLNLRQSDYVFSNHRGHGHAIAKGADMKLLMAELFGKKTGCSKGKGGSMHIVDMTDNIPGTSAIVGGGIPIAVGAALASRMRQKNRVTAVFFGDGAAEEGAFYESLNFAALKKLPVVFICENNFYATNSRQEARHASCKIASVAQAFGIEGICIDGNDAAEVYRTSNTAVAAARRGHGPTLIEAKTYRWKGHVGTEEDHVKGARPAEELGEWKEKCPLKRFKEKLLEEKTVTDAELGIIERAVRTEVEESVEYAEESPFPGAEELLDDIYSE